MGRKSSAKSPSSQGAPPPRPAAGSKGINPFVIVVVIAAVVGVGVLAFWQGDGAAVPGTEAASASSTTTPQLDPKAVAKAEALAKIGPHKQATLPPIPFAAYAPPRPHAVVTSAYHFAAEHPEILSYVPCFCGCER